MSADNFNPGALLPNGAKSDDVENPVSSWQGSDLPHIEDEFIYVPAWESKKKASKGPPTAFELSWLYVEVSDEFRTQVGNLYPALNRERGLWGLLTAFLFAPSLDGRYNHSTEQEILMPYERVAQAVGRHPKSRGFSALRWLEQFSEQVFPLKINEYRYVEGKATTVIVCVPRDLQELVKEERKRMSALFFAEQSRQLKESCHDKKQKPDTGVTAGAAAMFQRQDDEKGDDQRPLKPSPTLPLTTVLLHNGQRIIDREKDLGLAQLRYERRLNQQNIPPTHPGYQLVQFHIARSKGRKESLIFRRNIPALNKALDAVPDGDSQARRRDLARDVIRAMGPKPEIYYATSKGSPRLFTWGANPLRLPREYRSIAYGGCHEFDLEACQLAIVSKIWNIPALHQSLKAGMNIWNELYENLGLEPRYKPMLKQGLYSIIFGGIKKHIAKRMAKSMVEEIEISPEVADDICKRFFKNPTIAAVRRARVVQEKLIRKQGGARDASGNFHSILGSQRRLITSPKWRSNHSGKKADVNGKVENNPMNKDDGNYQLWRRRAIRSLMAYIVQSYEVDLMTALVPAMTKDSQTYLLAILFDAVIIEFGNKTKVERGIRQMQKAVRNRAVYWDIPTQLGHKLL